MLVLDAWTSVYLAIILMSWYVFQNCIWSCSRFVEQGVYFQSAGFSICVTTVLGRSPCNFLTTVPTPLSGLNTYLGKYWAANHMPCSLCALKTHYSQAFYYVYRAGAEKKRTLFFVSFGPNRSLSMQVNFAEHECSLSAKCFTFIRLVVSVRAAFYNHDFPLLAIAKFEWSSWET